MNQTLWGQQGFWDNLPTIQQSWSAAQQSPWRLSTFSTEGMPTGAAVQAPTAQSTQLPSNYLPQGTSGSLEEFTPLQSGGGFYPTEVPQQQQQDLQDSISPGLQPTLWESTGPVTGGQVFSNSADARASANRWNNLNVADSGEWNLSQGTKQFGTGRDW